MFTINSFAHVYKSPFANKDRTNSHKKDLIYDRGRINKLYILKLWNVETKTDRKWHTHRARNKVLSNLSSLRRRSAPRGVI